MRYVTAEHPSISSRKSRFQDSPNYTCTDPTGAVFVWRASTVPIFLAALVGGLEDAGYFNFVDLGGCVNFTPGTPVTLVSSGAIIAGMWTYGIARGQVS